MAGAHSSQYRCSAAGGSCDAEQAIDFGAGGRAAPAGPTGAHRAARPARRSGAAGQRARALVLFAHGSGSSRLSPRNRFVASALQQHGLGTLLFDLLDDDEAADRRKVFDIALLAERLLQALDWVRAAKRRWRGAADRPVRRQHRRGRRAVRRRGAARAASAAVVSRGGRPDLAGPRLAQVQAPTLLIVGGADAEVLALNRQALRELRCEKRLEIVPGATHLFEEPGALDSVARACRRLVRDPSGPRGACRRMSTRFADRAEAGRAAGRAAACAGAEAAAARAGAAARRRAGRRRSRPGAAGAAGPAAGAQDRRALAAGAGAGRGRRRRPAGHRHRRDGGRGSWQRDSELHRSAGAGAVARDRAPAPRLPERPRRRCRWKGAR